MSGEKVFGKELKIEDIKSYPGQAGTKQDILLDKYQMTIDFCNFLQKKHEFGDEGSSMSFM